jgi:hypothetical protein
MIGLPAVVHAQLHEAKADIGIALRRAAVRQFHAAEVGLQVFGRDRDLAADIAFDPEPCGPAGQVVLAVNGCAAGSRALPVGAGQTGRAVDQGLAQRPAKATAQGGELVDGEFASASAKAAP